jgi:hypothetical protein
MKTETMKNLSFRGGGIEASDFLTPMVDFTPQARADRLRIFTLNRKD